MIVCLLPLQITMPRRQLRQSGIAATKEWLHWPLAVLQEVICARTETLRALCCSNDVVCRWLYCIIDSHAGSSLAAHAMLHSLTHQGHLTLPLAHLPSAVQVRHRPATRQTSAISK
jgi:hypothetical protein